MGKNLNNKTKYRLVISQENDEGSWVNYLYKTKDPNDSELEEKYRFWLGILDSENGKGHKINGSKLENTSRLVDVHKQISYERYKSGKRKWKDYDDEDCLSKAKRYMR